MAALKAKVMDVYNGFCWVDPISGLSFALHGTYHMQGRRGRRRRRAGRV